jgi:uncharacterized protein YegJ (DUF2314 family)
MKHIILLKFICIIFTFANFVFADVPPKSSATAKVFGLNALYFSSNPPVNTIENLEALGKKYNVFVAPESEIKELPDKPILIYKWEKIQDFKPISKSNRRYLSIGINDSDVEAMHKASQVLVLTSSIPLHKTFLKNYKFIEYILYQIANITGAYIWDESTRLCYSQESWKENLIESWQSNIPDMSKQINMHSYRNGELIRIVTLGLDKFFLPDLAVENVPQGYTTSMGHLLNIIAQHFIEGSLPNEKDQVLVHIKKLKHRKFREEILSYSYPNAKALNRINLKETKTKDGDNNNFLYTIDFNGLEGDSLHEKQIVLLTSIFGKGDDNVEMVEEGNLMLLLASKRAKKRIIKQKSTFKNGPSFNERLLLKISFSENGHDEFMWVELISWKNNSITGVLMNRPNFISNIKAGAKVNFSEKKIYDYTWYKSDGTVEGNETGKIIEKLNNNKH